MTANRSRVFRTPVLLAPEETALQQNHSRGFCLCGA